MKEKTKKILLMAGLVAVAVLLVAGISMCLYREEKKTLPEDTKPVLETEVVVDTEAEDEPEEKTDTEELVIEPEEKTDINAKEQDLQPDPVKTEEEKPSEPPTPAENTDMENPNVTPAYEDDATVSEPAAESSNAGGTPQNGDTKDGMIYIEGFGWVVDEGGGGVGIQADDMYENGNKIGIMD